MDALFSSSSLSRHLVHATARAVGSVSTTSLSEAIMFPVFPPLLTFASYFCGRNGHLVLSLLLKHTRAVYLFLSLFSFHLCLSLQRSSLHFCAATTQHLFWKLLHSPVCEALRLELTLQWGSGCREEMVGEEGRREPSCDSHVYYSAIDQPHANSHTGCYSRFTMWADVQLLNGRLDYSPPIDFNFELI